MISKKRKSSFRFRYISSEIMVISKKKSSFRFCYISPEIMVISKKKKFFTLTRTCISHFSFQLHINPNKKLPFCKTVFCFWFFDRHCKEGWHAVPTSPQLLPCFMTHLEDYRTFLFYFFCFVFCRNCASFCISQQITAIVTD